MKPQEKTSLRVELATKGIIAALEAFDETHPGECITKSELLPRAIKRVEWIMEDDYKDIYDEEAFGLPTLRFFLNHWPEIGMKAAEEFKKYIVWDSDGVRLGTFEEYQEMQFVLTENAKGIKNSVNQRNFIVRSQGGQPYSIQIQIKQLPSGLGK